MKIEPHELRIGNYVNYFGRIVEVKGMHGNALWTNEFYDAMALIDGSVIPIKLTEEWLF